MKRKHRLDIADKSYSFIMTISYLILCIVSMLSLLIVVYNGFRTQLQKQAYDIEQAQLEKVADSVSTQMDYYMTSVENTFAEPHVTARLYAIKHSSQNEYDIYRSIYSSIVNDTYIDYCTLVNEEGICQILGPKYPNSKEQQELIQKLGETKSDLDFFFSEDGRRIYLFHTEREKLNAPPSRGVVYAVNVKRFEMLLSKGTNTCSQLVFDKNGKDIFRNHEFQESELQQFQEYMQNKDLGSGYKPLAVNGKNYFVNTIYDKTHQLTFLQVLDFTEINDMVHAGLRKSQSLVIMIVLICCMIASVLSYLLYLPLAKFFDKMSEYSSLLENEQKSSEMNPKISSDQIVLQFSEMSKKIHTYNVLRFLEEESMDNNPPHGLSVSEQKEKVLLILIKNKVAEIEDECIKDMYRILVKDFSEFTIREFLEEKSNYCLLVLSWKYEMTYDRKILLDKLNNSLQGFYNQNPGYYLVCSSFLEKENELQPAFREMLQITRYVLMGEIDFLCDMETREPRIEEDIPKEWFTPLFDMVKKEKETEAKLEIMMLLKKIQKYEIHKIIHGLSYVSTELGNIGQQMSAQTKRYQEMYMDHYIRISSLVNQKQLHDYLGKMIEDACLELKTSKERNLRTNMIDALDYINSHFMESEISVDSVAAIFHISPSYFSRMFREICDMSFPEYVNDLRLEYAANLLQNSNVPVKDIATTAGFSGTSYFSSQFKKKYAVSPSAYRNRSVPKAEN